MMSEKSVGHLDVFILHGYRIDGILERFDNRNHIEGIEFRLEFLQDQFGNQEMVDNDL